MNNELTVEIYSSGTTKIADLQGDLLKGEGLYFENGYPVGSLAGSMFVPRDPRRWWEIDKPLHVIIRNGLDIVYEGKIPNTADRFTETLMGTQINFIGTWGWFAMNRTWHKRWADNRTDERVWLWNNASTAADKCTIQRDARLYFLPKAESWANNDQAATRYIMPVGNINRITFSYDLTGAAGEDWTASLYDFDNASTEWSVNQAGLGTSSGTVDLDSTNDYTPTTEFRFLLKNTQGGAITPASDGSTYLKITDLMVYGEDETGVGINLNSVATDIISEFSTIINSDTAHLDATNLRTVQPFISGNDGPDTIANILFDIAGFGDTNDNRYAVGFKFSEEAATVDGKAVMFTDNWPTTTTHDLYLSPDDPNLASELNIRRDYDSIRNYITVQYRDENGWLQTVTPSDDATLTDSTSVNDYGQRDETITLGNSTQQNAVDYGVRYLNRFKDPLYIVDSTIDILDSIAGSNGNRVPVSKIRGGEVLKIDGYADNFIISRARYDYDSDIVSLSIGPVEDPLFTASVFAPTWDDPLPDSSGSTNAGKKKQPWWKIQDLLGAKGRKKLKAEGKWEQWKREHAPWNK